ncbi:FPN1 iron exporter [Gelatoporia subvermispora B]|uniref:Solute carrier family 40 member n=1 Tax=Ceriporiopsis subvermispora (strain B) TaxID=914234 RepID=M2QZC8_CERS8|nr:FPN1 iron exporter [Gelatoporia subvermispora B]
MSEQVVNVAPIPTESLNESEPETAPSLDRKALSLLLVQHFSNSWGIRTAEFAIYLLLVTLFPDTLLPASLYGLFTTGFAIFLSGWAGRQVDIRNNLRIVQACIVIIKLADCGAYGATLVLLTDHSRKPSNAWGSTLSRGMFSLIIIAGCAHNLVNVAISVSIERDWVTVIAGGSSDNFTKLNTYMRRIDLLCKLLAPLFVSLLTTAGSYTFAAYFLCAIEGGTMLFELIWITIVYRRFPVLRGAQVARDALQQERIHDPHRHRLLRIHTSLKNHLLDWNEFIHHPVFLSSLSISCLYFTVLSFDGTMLSYLKAVDYSDPFLAGMRGLNVVAGLAGTLAMPILERKLGLVRAGNWSIWSEVLCLIPAVVSFFVGAPSVGGDAPAWNSALLFGGMMLSRIGLWAFDLCQLKELQTALESHPRRNTITALQFSLQNMADMLKYVLTAILSRPSQFKWAALASYVSVVIGALTYLLYVRKERGHIFHIEISERVPLLMAWRAR